MPWPARIVENRPRKGDQVSITSTDNGFGLLKLGNEPYGDHGHARFPLHGPRELHLIARTDRNLRRRSETATRHVNGGATAPLQRLRKRDCLVDIPAAVHPVGG